MYKNVIDKQLTAGQTLAIPHTMTKKLFTDMSYPWLIIVEPFPHDSTKGAHIELVSWDMDYITLKNCEAVTVPMMIYMDQMHSVSTAHKDSDQYTPQIPPIVAPNFGTLPSSETLNSVGTRVRSPMYICLKDTVQPAFNPNSLVTKYVNPGLAHTDIDGSGVWAAGDDANSGDDKLHPWLNIQTAVNRHPDNCSIYLIKVDETVNHCARSYAIQSYVAGANGQIVLSLDQSAFLEVGQHVRITGSDNPVNNNSYTILSIVVAGDTTITFNEPIAAATAGVGTFYGVGADEETITIQDDGRSSPIIISGTPKHIQRNLIHGWPIIGLQFPAATLTVAGDVTSFLSLNQPVEIRGSTANDGYLAIHGATAPVYDPVNDWTTITLAAPIAPSANLGTLYDGQYRNYDVAYPEGWSSLICKLDRPISCYNDIKLDWINLFKIGSFSFYLEVKILEYETIDPVNFIYKLKLGGDNNYSIATGGFGIYRFVGCSRLRPGTILRGNNNADYSLMRIAGNYIKTIFANIEVGDEINSSGKVFAMSCIQGNTNFLGMVNVFTVFLGNDQCDMNLIFTNTILYTMQSQIQNIINDNSLNYFFNPSENNIASFYPTNILNFKFYNTNFFGLYSSYGTLAFEDSTEPTGNYWIRDFYVRNAKIEFWDGQYIFEFRATMGRGFSMMDKLDMGSKISFRNWMVAHALCPTYKNSFIGDPVTLSDGLIGRIYQRNSEIYAEHPILFPDDASLSRCFMHLNHNSKFYSESYVEASKTDGTLGDMFWIENNSEFICLGDPVLSRDCADYNGAIHNYVFNVNNSYLRCGDVEIDIVAALQTQGMQGLFKLTNSDAVFNTFYCDYERDVNVSNFGGADINGANNGMMVMDEKSSLVFESVIDGRDNASLLIDRINVGGNPLIAEQFYMFKAMDSYTITSIGNFIFNGVDIGGAAVGHYFYFDGNGSFDIRGLKIEEAPEINGLQGFLATKVPIFMLNQAEGFCLEAIYCLVYGAAAGSLPTRFLRMWLDTELLCNAIGFYAGDPTHTFGESYILDDITVAYDSKLTVVTGGAVSNYIDMRYFTGTWEAYGNRYASLYVLNSEFINLGRVEFVLEKGGRVLNFINSRIKTAGLRFLGDSTGAVVIPTILATPYPTEVFITSCSDVCMFMNSIDFRSGDYGDYVGIYGNDYVHTWIIIDDSSRVIVECEPTEAALPGYNVFDATAYQTNNCAIALRNASVILCKEVHDPDTARGTYYWACLRDDDPINVYQDFHLGAVGAVATVDTWPTSVTGKWNDVNADNLGAAGNPGLAELVLVSLPAPPVG